MLKKYEYFSYFNIFLLFLLLYLWKEVFIVNDQLLNFLTSQGVFALLFGYLLLYVLKQNQTREQNYQKIIQDLNSILPNIKNDLDDIKKKILN